MLSDRSAGQSRDKIHFDAGSAVLAMILALSTSSSDTAQSKAFYKEATLMLNTNRIRGASLTIIQAFMLVVIYQQNHQMSVTSWTYHALAVKTAFQLGLQSPMTYLQFGQPERHLRLQLWYSLATQDRILAACLGRPCLIPCQYIRTAQLDDSTAIQHNASIARFQDAHGMVYHTQLTSLYQIVESILHNMYSDNIEIMESISAAELISARMPLQWQLQDWCRKVPVSCRVLTTDMLNIDASAIGRSHFCLFLSIHYYRASLWLNAPALLALSRQTPEEINLDDQQSLLEHAVPIVRYEFSTLQILQKIMTITIGRGTVFLDENSVWWLCNYTCEY